MPDPRRYLLPTERRVIEVRRHWAVLAGDTAQSLALLAVGVLLLRIFSAPAASFARALAIYFIVFVLLRWGWIMADWWVEKFIVTDKRVLLITGIANRKVAIMPLVKVTDLTFNRSGLGLMLGYGEFVVESAGQDQALSKVNYIPKPEKLYIQISELLFGGDKGGPALPSPAELEAELEAGRRALRRRRWRSWGTRRDRGQARQRPSQPAEPLGGLDDLLAHRDTLLAEHRGTSPGPAGTEEPTAELPRIHSPRRDPIRPDFPPRPSRQTGPPMPRREEPPHAPPIDPSDD